jgi:Peptidase family M23/GW (Gly-Tryp) dipeptide domain
MKRKLATLMVVLLIASTLLIELPAKAASTFIYPHNGVITTDFGWDTLNGKQRYHYGLDIDGNTGDAVKASAAGKVVYSQYHYGSTPEASYGNRIIIQHNINGQIYETLYAHLNSRNVSVGSNVTQGQVIGTVGDTGYSFGSHLHFELHRGSWNANKSNAIDPESYLNKVISTPPQNSGVEAVYHVIKVDNPKWGLYSSAGPDPANYIEPLNKYKDYYMVADQQQWVNGSLYYRLTRGDKVYGWAQSSQVSTIAPVWHTVEKTSQGYYRAEANDAYKAHLIPSGSEVRLLAETENMYIVLYNEFPQYILKNPPLYNSGVEPVYHVAQISNPKWGLYSVAGAVPANYIEPLSNYDDWYMVLDQQQWVNGSLYYRVTRGDTVYGWAQSSQFRTIAPEWYTVKGETQGYYRDVVDPKYVAHKIPDGSKVRLLGESNGMKLVLYNEFPQYIKQ